VSADPAALAEATKRYGWYHTLDLGNGVVTEGMFDHRPVLDRYLIPADLSGARCLDVGTMDGFWAFEMERRGAAEVLAIDLEDPERLDWPHALRDKVVKTMDVEKGERFELARSALGSKVQRILLSVYELGDSLGTFDFVFCGDLLVHLKDPVSAVENMRAACRGSATVCNPITRVRFAHRRPLAEIDGVDNFQWWLPNETALLRLMTAAGFERVERGRPFELPTTQDPRAWRGLRGVVRGYA
jgi:tRNA (mo5U34)-methyltransferase